MLSRHAMPWVIAVIAVSFLLPTSLLAQRKLVIKIRNANPTFEVKASADRVPPVYKGGESFKLNVQTTADAYVYVFNCMEDGNVYCLLPNQVQKDNFVKANKSVAIPAKNAPYFIEVNPPYGSEYVKVVASKQKLGSLDLRTLQKAVATQIKSPEAMKLQQELKEKDSRSWAEDTVLIQTVAPDEESKPSQSELSSGKKPVSKVDAPQRRRKRIALHIGLSYYEDATGFRNSACAKDAQAMAKVMKEKAGFEVRMILNREATRDRIIKVLQSLESTTSPGDVITIHWSGSVDRQRSRGSQVDALVPFDAEMSTTSGRTRSLITEEDLAEVLGRLKGRRIICLFETYRYRESRFGSRSIDGLFSDLVDKLADLRGGQPNLVLIESCQMSQKPHAHKETQLSVMTHYFASSLANSPTSTTVGKMYQQIADQVENYVRITYRDSQRPSLSYHGSLHFSFAK